MRAKGDFDKTFDQYMAAQKKAQEETEKSNDKNKKAKLNYGELADQVGKTSTVLARSADAFGLPANALRTLDDVMDVAEIGLNNLSKSAVGFNAASIGVAGAGLAIGTAIGSWLNTFPEVRKAADDVVAALYKMATGTKLADDNLKAMRGTGDQAALTLSEFAKHFGELDKIQRARRPMVTDEELAKIQKAKEETKLWADAQAFLGRQANTLAEAQKAVAFAEEHSEAAARKREEASKRAHEAAMAAAAQRQRITEEAFERSKAEAIKIQEETLKIIEFAKTHDLFEMEAAKRQREAAAEFIKAKEDEARAMDAMNDKVEEDAALEKADAEATEENARAHDELARAISDYVDNALSMAQTMLDLPASFEAATSSANRFRNALGGAQLGSQVGGQIGSMFGPMGEAIGRAGGAIVGGIAGLFGGGEGKKVNDLRDQFISAAGGLDELRRRAADAGLTLDRLLHAGKVRDFEAAIQELNGAFDSQAEAERKVREAMQEFGISVGEMGPKWAQQELDKKAMELLEKYKLLTAAGADHSVVLEHMGPAFLDYINNARQAGVAIPESLREVVNELIAQGKLLDENGVAFGSAEQAGITFAESVGDAMSRAADQMQRLVDAISRLYGLGPINIPVNVGGGGGGNGGGNGPFVPDMPSFGGGGTADWPMGQPRVAELHGGEHVFDNDQLEALMTRAISAAMAQSRGAGDVQVFIGGEQLMPVINRYRAAGY